MFLRKWQALTRLLVVPQFWRQQLGRFGLSGAHQTAPIKQLSDGLRNRFVRISPYEILLTLKRCVG